MSDFAELPPEINSGRMYTGPGSEPLLQSAAAWHLLGTELGSVGLAYQAVIDSLLAGGWQGPTALTMAQAAAPYVVWLLATAAQQEAAAVAADKAAAVFEAARGGVVPPAEIELNRNTLQALLATNFLGVNTPAIAATIAAYDAMWVQDVSVLYGYAADASAVASGIAGTPFTPPLPTTNPAGLAAQGASVAQASGQAAGNASQHAATAGTEVASMPAGMDAQSMLTMGPQLVSMIPQALQGFSQPATAPLQSLGQFQSLLSPLMSSLNNPGLTSAMETSALVPAAAGGAPVSALGGGGGLLGGAPVSAALGGGGNLGGLSAPATWAASASQNGTTVTTSAVVPASGSAPSAAAPASTGGSGMAGAPVAAMARDGQGEGGPPRYGSPIRVRPEPA
ncbi:PPE family protein [Mycobacterium sp. DSM 3803]|nr:PPE family protein [Mycobacterium sp. DSM 3803]